MTTPEEQFENELGKITGATEQAAFRYFFAATKKENIPVRASYTWDQFRDGIAPFDGTDIALIDDYVRNRNLIPNYDQETCREHKLREVVPFLESLEGPFIKMIHRTRQDSAVRIMGPHPSLATPYLFARALSAAYYATYGIDIREDIVVVTGAYPTVMAYELAGEDGELTIISPVLLGRSLASLALTAPKTANTETGESAVQDWMNSARARFKIVNRDILSQPGKILIEHPGGRRGERSKAKVPPFHHREFRPDSSLRHIIENDVPTFIIGVHDQLMSDPDYPSSIVEIHGDPRPYHFERDAQVIAALSRACILGSNETHTYSLEGWKDQAKRLGKKIGGIVLRKESDGPSPE